MPPSMRSAPERFVQAVWFVSCDLKVKTGVGKGCVAIDIFLVSYLEMI